MLSLRHFKISPHCDIFVQTANNRCHLLSNPRGSDGFCIRSGTKPSCRPVYLPSVSCFGSEPLCPARPWFIQPQNPLTTALPS